MLEGRDRGGGHRTVQGKVSEHDPEDADMWEKEISRIRADGAFVFSDSSLLEGGNVRGGVFVMNKDKQAREFIYGVRTVATVWDGEIAGIAEELASILGYRNCIVFAARTEPCEL